MISKSELRVSAITVNHNEKACTLDLVQSILSSSFQPVEIVIVDNSTDPDEIIYEQAQFRVIHTRNLGYAAALNSGIRTASGDYLLLLNNDIIFPDGQLDNLISAVKDPREHIALSPIICTGPQNEVEFAGFTPINPYTGRNRSVTVIKSGEALSDTAYLHGACMLVNRECVELAGYLPEIYFLYYEEMDWSVQLKNAGCRLVVANNSRIHHKKSVSVNKLGRKSYFYLNRNRILFQRRNTRWYQKIIFFSYLLLFSIPVNIIRNFMKGKAHYSNEFIQAVIWNLGNKKKVDGAV